MTDDFRSYETLRDLGASPRAIYRAGQDDGLDPIARIRMVRAVCGLSLADAKRASDSDRTFTTPQSTEDGAIVSWEIADPAGEGRIRQGRVLAQRGDRVQVLTLGDYSMTTGEPLGSEQESLLIPIRVLQKTLIERLEEVSRSWEASPRPVGADRNGST